VCLACLLPLFLVPIINLLPVLFDFIMGKVYRLFGWEYRKPVRAPPACPYKPAANKSSSNAVAEPELGASEPVHKPAGVDDSKLD
ncbi:Translation initiation factor IF-2 like, partial [Actinidia chinensis var. chinensis]